MKTPYLVIAILLLISGCAVYAYSSHSPLFLELNGEKFFPDGGVTISGQGPPRDEISVQILYQAQIVYQSSTKADSDGHFKISFLPDVPLTLGNYTVKIFNSYEIVSKSFIVIDRNTILYDELVGIVNKTRAEAKAVYRLLDPKTELAAEIKAHIEKIKALPNVRDVKTSIWVEDILLCPENFELEGLKRETP